MATLRNKQLAPTTDVLEEVYGSLRGTSAYLIRARLDLGQEHPLVRTTEGLHDAVTLLADLVDRHIPASDLERRVDDVAGAKR